MVHTLPSPPLNRLLSCRRIGFLQAKVLSLSFWQRRAAYETFLCRYACSELWESFMTVLTNVCCLNWWLFLAVWADAFRHLLMDSGQPYKPVCIILESLGEKLVITCILFFVLLCCVLFFIYFYINFFAWLYFLFYFILNINIYVFTCIIQKLSKCLFEYLHL